MAGRSVKEWVGRSPDSVPPDEVKARVFLRANGRCHISRRKIQTGEQWQLEHIKPLSMGGENRESNMAPALGQPHKGKSAFEAGVRSKADRIKLKHIGAWERPKGNARMQSRGFEPGRNRR